MSDDAFWFGEVQYEVLKGKDGIRKAYDEMAYGYDYSRYLYWTRRMEEDEERITEKWFHALSPSVLDIGCGTGRYSIKAAKKGFETIALDLSLRMLKMVREKARINLVLGKVHLVLADGENLPFRDKSFNSIICTLTFDHFINPDSASQGFSRVLKLDGVLLLSVFNSHMLNVFQRKYGIPINRVPFKTGSSSGMLIYEVGHSAGEVGKLFSKHGLRITNMRGCCYWHLVPTGLFKHYRSKFDAILNFFKPLLKYAEIHVILLKKISTINLR